MFSHFVSESHTYNTLISLKKESSVIENSRDAMFTLQTEDYLTFILS